MQKLMIALLLLPFAGCAEEPAPPKPKKAPEPPPVVKKVEPPAEKPKPPSPPPVEDKKPPTPASESVPKVMLDPTLPEWSQTAPAEFKVKFSTSKGDFLVQVKREWSPRGADCFFCLVKN